MSFAVTAMLRRENPDCARDETDKPNSGMTVDSCFNDPPPSRSHAGKCRPIQDVGSPILLGGDNAFDPCGGRPTSQTRATSCPSPGRDRLKRSCPARLGPAHICCMCNRPGAPDAGRLTECAASTRRRRRRRGDTGNGLAGESQLDRRGRSLAGCGCQRFGIGHRRRRVFRFRRHGCRGRGAGPP